MVPFLQPIMKSLTVQSCLNTTTYGKRLEFIRCRTPQGEFGSEAADDLEKIIVVHNKGKNNGAVNTSSQIDHHKISSGMQSFMD